MPELFLYAIALNPAKINHTEKIIFEVGPEPVQCLARISTVLFFKEINA
jgi:hypothetical protein